MDAALNITKIIYYVLLNLEAQHCCRGHFRFWATIGYPCPFFFFSFSLTQRTCRLCKCHKKVPASLSPIDSFCYILHLNTRHPQDFCFRPLYWIHHLKEALCSKSGVDGHVFVNYHLIVLLNDASEYLRCWDSSQWSAILFRCRASESLRFCRRRNKSFWK